MALVPYFLLSPNTILSIIGLIRGEDKTIPTPSEDWRKAKVNVVIPTFNEHYTITLCLASLMHQTFPVNKIIIIDDGSQDETVEYVTDFCKVNALDVELIQRREPIGKTPTIKRQSREFEADVEFILDGDTILVSSDYISRCVEELYQGIGIASACGVIKPLYDKERIEWFSNREELKKFLKIRPHAKIVPPKSVFSRLRQGIANLYRDVLYTYLQKFLYIGQMNFFGSIVNPIGCAVAYRQKYVKDLFDKYEPIYSDNLTNSEDIFIGFALANEGYRNIQVQNIYAHSREPHVDRLPKQIYMWSSSFLQSCFYFPDLFLSPFKLFRRLKLKREYKRNKEAIEEKRKIKEAYRQRFGTDWTKKYGRPIGWAIFLSTVEKVVFSLVLWLFILMGWWFILGLTLLLESTFALLSLAVAAKGERWKYLGKGILATPIRYLSVLTDIFTLVHFALETWVYKYREWRK